MWKQVLQVYIFLGWAVGVGWGGGGECIAPTTIFQLSGHSALRLTVSAYPMRVFD